MRNLLFIIILLFSNKLFACEQGSDFQIGLLGSIVTPGLSVNSALIKLRGSKAGWFYEGDVIQTGYVLNKIHKDYILVVNDNKYIRIYLNSCEPLVEIDNPGLYLAAADVNESSDIAEGLTNTELTVQQQRTFLKTPITNYSNAETKTQEKEQPEELRKDQMRIFNKITEQKIEKENIAPDI